MNGHLSMYKLKPVVNFPDPVDLTTTMYRMKNIYSSNLSSAKACESSRILPNILEQKSTPEVEILKKRQEAILNQLMILKEQMLVLREELNKKPSSVDLSKNSTRVDKSLSNQEVITNRSWTDVIGEVVVHASPDYPPYSLLCISKLWPQVRLSVSCHTHSSVVTVPQHLNVFTSLAPTSSPSLQVRLIWKNMGPDCELIISPLSHCPIRGEVNLLRYLHRSVSTTTNLETELLLDNIFDTCHQLNHSHTQRDKQVNIRALIARLGKAQWLGGEAMSVSDAAAWSAVKSLTGIEFSQNISRWHSQCSAVAGLGDAE